MHKADQRAWEGLEALESRALLSAIAWDGGGDGVRWEDPLNWSTDALPGPGDDVTIDVPGLATITHTSNAVESVHTITCDEQLTLQGGTFFVASDWQQSGPMSLLGARIIGSGNLIITGDAHWLTGRMDGPGFIQVASGGTLSIDGSIITARPIYNGGTLAWTAGNISDLGFNITNLAGQTISITSPGTLSGLPGAGIDSAGDIDIAGSAQITIPLSFSNAAARLHVLSGAPRISTSQGSTTQLPNVLVDAPSILTLNGRSKLLSNSQMTGSGGIVLSGGSHTLAGSIWITGSLTVQQNATANFGASSIISQLTLAGGSLVGAGSLIVTNFRWGPGLVGLTGPVTVTNISSTAMGANGTPVYQLTSLVTVNGVATFGAGDFHMISGGFTGPGELRYSGRFFWDGGTLTGSGAFRIGGTLTGAAAMLVQRNVVLNGDVTIVGIQEMDLINTTITTVQNTGVAGNLHIPVGQTLHIGGLGAFRNPGRHLYVDGVLSVGAGVSFSNTGVLHLTGRLIVPGSSVVELVNGELTGGQWIITDSGRLQMTGAAIRTNSALIVISGRNAGFGALSTLDDNRGTLDFFNGGSLAVHPANGTLLNEGVLKVYAGSTLAIVGNFRQTSSGLFQTSIGGAGSGILWVTGLATLNGAIAFDMSVGPPAPVPFWFIRASAISGTFHSDMSYLHATSGAAGQLQYLQTQVRLIYA